MNKQANLFYSKDEPGLCQHRFNRLIILFLLLDTSYGWGFAKHNTLSWNGFTFYRIPYVP